MATFGERLKFLRDQKGVTQEDLAELLGVNKQTISGYERGVRRPAGETSLPRTAKNDTGRKGRQDRKSFGL